MGSFEGDPVASEESLTDIGIAVPKSHKRSKSSPRGCRNPQEAITTRLQSRTQVSYDAAEKSCFFILLYCLGLTPNVAFQNPVAFYHFGGLGLLLQLHQLEAFHLLMFFSHSFLFCLHSSRKCFSSDPKGTFCIRRRL